MRFHIVIDQITGELTAREVDENFTLADGLPGEPQKSPRDEPPRVPVAFVSPQELDAAVAHALQSSPRWRRRQRGRR